jgi:hypothetical protein
MAEDEVKFLYVKSAFPDDRVALHEVDDLHPGGSVIVAGKIVAKVADTPFVRLRLRDRWLVEASESKEKSAADKWADERSKSMSAVGDTSIFADIDRQDAPVEERADFNRQEVEAIAARQDKGDVDDRDPVLSDKAMKRDDKAPARSQDR